MGRVRRYSGANREAWLDILMVVCVVIFVILMVLYIWAWAS